ncbi:hypothetical protein FA13DRAFT_1795041 [Coprinellus micaceus]|uniref:Uncharacterized protein n=1 Tax=Coprinellus micaceus TaxID=71717 RepID=A0A4Y7SZZ8_COPMI|nr:hypothetical protein FA13DRAFT_1795041 [Coprinellus micaceus]
MASPPLRLDSLTAQQWPSCYHYCAIRIYFAISAWNKYVRGVYDRSQKVRPAVYAKFSLGEYRWNNCSGHGAVLEHGRHQGRLVAEVTNIMLHKERAANPTDLRNFLARWESGAGEWRTTLLPWWDSLPSVNPDETFTSLANLIDIFNREIAVGGLPVPDADWVIRSHLPEEQQRLEQLQHKDILTAQALFNFYAHRRNVIVAFPSTAAPWWAQPNGPWPRPTLQTWIDAFLTSAPSFTEASERYMAQAMDLSAPTTDLLGEGIVDAQMGMHVVAKRRQEVRAAPG